MMSDTDASCSNINSESNEITIASEYMMKNKSTGIIKRFNTVKEKSILYEDVDKLSEKVINDLNLCKLIRLLNSFLPTLRGSMKRLGERIKAAIPFHTTFTSLIEGQDLTFDIYILLYHLNTTLDIKRHVSPLIFAESLLDEIDDRYNISDEWDVANITKQIE